MTIGVVVADDQAIVRAGFRLLIDSEPDLMVLGEAGAGDPGDPAARAVSQQSAEPVAPRTRSVASGCANSSGSWSWRGV